MEKLLESFTKRNCKKQIKKCLELKKQSREKVINYMLNGKASVILLMVGLSENFPKPKSSGVKVKVELDLSNHATNANLKNATNTWKFAKTVDLCSLKSDIDKLDIHF